MFAIISWAVLGAVAGLIARAIYPGHQGFGILGTIILGIIGSFVGGSLFNLITTGSLAITAASGSIIGSIIVSVIGAIVALFIYYAITKRTA